MATIELDSEDDHWYVDTRCFNHMTGHREWLIDLDSNIKSKVRFVVNSFVMTEGLGKVVIQGRKGDNVIHYVLYIPSMKNNLVERGLWALEFQ